MNEHDRDTLLLETILDQPIPTIANIIQVAHELRDFPDRLPTLYDRLASAYYELTNTDPAALTDRIRLRKPDDDDDERN